MTTEAVLRRITALVVRCLDPDQVVLFGSVAKGRAKLHSDVDMLVLGAFRGPRHRRALELRGLLARYPIHVDLHAFTPAELAIEAQKPFGWISTLAATARLLYVKTPKKGKDPFTRSDEVPSDTQKSFCDAAFLLPDYSALTCEYNNFKFFRDDSTLSADRDVVNTLLQKKGSRQ